MLFWLMTAYDPAGIGDEVIERGLARLSRGQDVDGRNKPGHDALRVARHERNTL